MFHATLVALVVLTQTASPEGSATLPLKEALSLFEKTPKPVEKQSPVPAVLEQLELQGRLAPDALHLHAKVELNVLAKDSWTQVELFALGDGGHLTQVPTLENASVAVVAGKLMFLTQTAGRYSFELSWTQRAQGPSTARQVELVLGPQVAPTPLLLMADAALVTLKEGSAVVRGEGFEVYPSRGRYSLSWTSAQARKTSAPSVRPPLEPSIPAAHAVVVSTLEGRATVRVRYSLRLDREQPLEVVLPPRTRLERVLHNQVPLALPQGQEGQPVRLTVAPGRLGESEGSLELVLTREYGVFHLSGQVELELPRVSWPVSEVRGRVYLPEVFSYRQGGGSVQLESHGMGSSSPANQAPADWPTAGTVLPGRLLEFRQYLVAASAPTLVLDYSVDISRSYFH
jgi:hypothetical protein